MEKGKYNIFNFQLDYIIQGIKMKYSYMLKGLDCANCAAKIENAIQKIEGVETASVSFMTQKLVVTCEESKKDVIMKQIKKIVKKEEPDVKVEGI